jgi:2-methylisocitrate lyase-like PEP mutase family enzyme
VQAARQAIDNSGCDVLLTARAECYHVGHPDALNESVRRLQAYAEAGADVLFAPGVKDTEEIKVLVEAIQPIPFNLLVVSDIGLRVDDIAAPGVRRISVGGAFALAAWNGFMRAAEILNSKGSFSELANVASYADVNGFLSEDFGAREHRTRAHGAGA